MNTNTELWDAVCETDPANTKGFNRGGGFKGTAISPIYLARKATEQWGPCGEGWGYNIEDERYVEGAPLEGGVREVVHVVRVALWYGAGGMVRHYGQTTFVGQNKNGVFTDEEAPKKSLTDALTKCLSMLGFSADVFMGLHDDNKYVNDMRAKFKGRGGTAGTNYKAMIRALLEAKGCTTEDEANATTATLTGGKYETARAAYAAGKEALDLMEANQ